MESNKPGKLIMTILRFIPFALIVYIIMVCFWGEFAPKLVNANLNYLLGSDGHLFTRLNEVKQTKDIDILFLGSSHTYRGFDPRIFREAGFKSFNLGSSAQTPIQTDILLDRYLDQLNPKTIIYEINPSALWADGVESSLDIISNDKIDHDVLIMALKQKNIKVLNTLIYGLYRDVLNRDAGFKEEMHKEIDHYIPGGYVQQDLQYFKHLKSSQNKWSMNSDQFRSFENVVNRIKAKNIRLILIQAPVTKARYNSYSNNDDFDKRVMTYGEYLNFNTISPLDDSLHFFDSHHLNQAGVDVFNKELIDRLLLDKR